MALIELAQHEPSDDFSYYIKKPKTNDTWYISRNLDTVS